MTQRGATYERQKADEYMTPEWAVEALLSVERIGGPVWEPACGHCGVVRVIERYSPNGVVLATDINPEYSRDERRGLDFRAGRGLDFLLKIYASVERLTIITNPPFGSAGKLAVAFVEHALALTEPVRGRVIMLLPSDWDCAKTRTRFFEPFEGHITKVTLTRRIRWTNLKQSVAGPSGNHAWYIWDHARKGRDMRWV